MVNVKKQIVDQSTANKVSYNGTNPVNYISIHQTGNTSVGANAQVHADLQKNGFSASWHYQVDDKEVIQSLDDSVQAWHAGDRRGKGNTESIAIEICINSDGNYEKAVENGAELAKHLLDKYNLGIDRLKQHHDWSGKNCPAQIRDNKDGISWDDFKKMVNGKKVSSPSSSGLPNATYYVKSPLFNGSGVRKVQEALASIYFYPEKGAPNNGVDGWYGVKTADAVRRYQSTKSVLVNDGDYGKNTKAELEKDI